MKYRESMGKIFRNYASSNLNKNQIDYEVQSEIGYLKQVLTGERRKKQDGCLWTWDSRIKEANRVLNHLSRYVLVKSEGGVIGEMFDTAFKNKYFAKKVENAGKDSSLYTTSMNISSTIENYFNIYSSIKDNHLPAVQRENLETITTKEEKSLVGAGARTRLATVALLAALGFGILTGAAVKGGYDNRIIKERESRIEQLVQEKEKPNMAIVTDLPSQELDKRYEKYVKSGKKILDLRYYVPEEESKDSIEYYTNKGQNKGNFVRGFMYSTSKMQIPPEYSEKDLKERERLQKKWANIGDKVKRDTKKIGDGLHDLVTFKHPIGGPLRAVSGFGGILNASVRGVVRPITYFFTRSDTVDRAIDDFADASYFGDSYSELHGNIFGLNFQKTRDFVKKHPIKSAISIAEDILPFLIKGGYGGDSGGGSVPGIPGRSGGAGTP